MQLWKYFFLFFCQRFTKFQRRKLNLMEEITNCCIKIEQIWDRVIRFCFVANQPNKSMQNSRVFSLGDWGSPRQQKFCPSSQPVAIPTFWPEPPPQLSFVPKNFRNFTTWWLDSDGLVTINCWQHGDCVDLKIKSSFSVLKLQTYLYTKVAASPG